MFQKFTNKSLPQIITTGINEGRDMFRRIITKHKNRTIEISLNKRRKLIRKYKKKYFSNSEFVGHFEKAGVIPGFIREQWEWEHRDWIRGVVLDMSTLPEQHEHIYSLETVEKVLVSDMDTGVVSTSDSKHQIDIVGDFCSNPPPMTENSVDTVLCLSILEHCEDPLAMVRNLAKIIRPGGYLFFFHPYAYIDGHCGDICGDYWRFGLDAYPLLCQKANIELVKTGQYFDMGKYFIHEYGYSCRATDWHRGVPTINWMIARRPVK